VRLWLPQWIETVGAVTSESFLFGVKILYKEARRIKLN
jgi:hypothetical protein